MLRWFKRHFLGADMLAADASDAIRRVEWAEFVGHFDSAVTDAQHERGWPLYGVNVGWRVSPVLVGGDAVRLCWCDWNGKALTMSYTGSLEPSAQRAVTMGRRMAGYMVAIMAQDYGTRRLP